MDLPVFAMAKFAILLVDIYCPEVALKLVFLSV